MSSIEVGSDREEAVLGHSKLSQLPLWNNISLLKLTLDGTRNLVVREGKRERERDREGEREGREWREKERGRERGRRRREGERKGRKREYAHIQLSSKGENLDIFSLV